MVYFLVAMGLMFAYTMYAAKQIGTDLRKAHDESRRYERDLLASIEPDIPTQKRVATDDLGLVIDGMFGEHAPFVRQKMGIVSRSDCS